MAQKVRRHPFGQTGELGTASEWPPNIGTAEARLAGLHHKQRLMDIGARLKIALYPLKRPRREEDRPLFIALADNPGLAGVKINAGADKGGPGGDPRAPPDQPPAQRSKTQPRHNNSAIGVVKPNGHDKPLDLDGRKEVDLPAGALGKTDVRRIEAG